MPLELYGSIISGIRVEFEGGRAVRIDADENAETLRVGVREGRRRARGSASSRSSTAAAGSARCETVFFDTLLDENAASHIALGSGYALAVEDEADKARINESQIHIDFMIGSPELDVDGITAAGEHVPVLRNGAWQI